MGHVQLNNVRMLEEFKDLDLAFNLAKHVEVLYFFAVKDLDSNLKQAKHSTGV